MGLAAVKSTCLDAADPTATANRSRASADEQTTGSATSTHCAGSSQKSFSGYYMAATG
ncbi:MAG TPA: hypothetical protein VGO67_22180 [Verrucomicrobiae bacterium]